MVAVRRPVLRRVSMVRPYAEDAMFGAVYNALVVSCATAAASRRKGSGSGKQLTEICRSPSGAILTCSASLRILGVRPVQ